MGIMGKACDSCRAAAAALFCRADAAFLCVGCDARIHCANRVASRHERVWVCEVCEQAPAAVTCKADAASLCVSCDADIHSANPLARRHDRVPVQPFFDHPSSSWAHSFPPKPDEPVNKGSADHHLLFSEMDSFLDFDYPASADSVVPVKVKHTHSPEIENNNTNPENCFHLEFSRSKLSSFAYGPPQCLSHSVSSSSLDVGVVPDRNSVSEISFAFGRVGADPIPTVPASTSSTTTATISPPATQLCGLDREARVLRYREKRKNRKFEKTIRYASRKAYAETRPRIKGRFAKRTDAETESYNDGGEFVDHIYGGSAFLSEAQYGVVPSF